MNLSLLTERSRLLQRLRQFFLDEGFIEVETPLLAAEIIPEAHIDPVELAGLGYMQASPEMAMKGLLCQGSGPIFQIGKCFRAGERGDWHAPEFTMVEWYRPGDGLLEGIDFVESLMSHLAGTPPFKRTSYRDAFRQHAGFDPFNASIAEMARGVGDFDAPDDRDEWLNYWLAKRVEPQLGLDVPEVVMHYPESQASLASIATDDCGTPVAERFELYWQGVELANGFHELTDADELRQRLEGANQLRLSRGAPALPLPERMLNLMTTLGLPPTTGVALGFDRLAMLMLGAKSIDEVLWRP